MNNPNRFYFIDNLRAIIIGLVIVFHAALCYMAYAPEWWYVLDPGRSFLFTIVVMTVDVFIMPIMFFCAGYFTYVSLRKKSSQQFLKDKQIRIGYPFIFGVLFIAPVIAYFTYFSRGVPVSFSTFWMGDYWGDMYQQAHYWFLGMLMLFFVLASLVAKVKPQILEKTEKPRVPSLGLFTLFIVVVSGAFFLMNLVSPLDAWFNKLYILSFQPVRLPVLIAYFMLGIYAEKNAWFTPQGYRPKLIGWTLLCLASAYLYVNYKLIFPEYKQVTLLLKGGCALAFNLFCFSTLMSLLAIFQTFFNSDKGLWKSFSSCSYAIYYVHMLIVFILVYIMIPYEMSVFVKFTVVSISAVFISWLFAIVMKKIPVLSRMF